MAATAQGDETDLRGSPQTRTDSPTYATLRSVTSVRAAVSTALSAGTASVEVILRDHRLTGSRSTHMATS